MRIFSKARLLVEGGWVEKHTISRQKDEKGQYTTRDVMEWRYLMDENEVMGIIRVSIVAGPVYRLE